MHDIGTRLAEFRKNKGWTQKQLAEHLHKSASAIGSYEQNVQAPPTDVLISLAKLYHTSIDGLLGLSNADTITVSGLNEKQRAVLKLILDEFNCPIIVQPATIGNCQPNIWESLMPFYESF